MFSFSELRQAQIEVTNRCQASCPMCARNIHGGIENPAVVTSEWSLEDFKQIFNEEVLAIMEHINFCGDYGEPTINNYLLEMCSYAKEVNPDICITINTNASTRTTQWWADLARALPKNHTVYFALDGLEDTHHLYRIGTVFKKIIDNAKAFISAGGRATWHFIAFKHNEHQVEEAEAMSKEIGFDNFVLKHSKRFGQSFPVLDKDGNRIYYIDPPTGSKAKPVTVVDVQDYRKIKDAKIDCMSLNGKDIFIDAHFKLTPCCFMGYFTQANFDIELWRRYGLEDFASFFPTWQSVRSGFYEYIEQLGGWDALDVKKHSIKEILSRDSWQTILKKEWVKNSNMAAPCIILCSDKSPFLKVEQQEINRAS